jgi:dCTP deaminase
MSVLSGAEILKRLEEDDDTKRLVVVPILEPNEQLKPDSASIDIRLGFEIALITPTTIAAIDELRLNAKIPQPVSLENLYRKHYVPFGDQIILHPHQFVLAASLEYLRLPPDLMAYVVGRSTWGRLGLTVATAIGIHPKFAGVLTLELRNLGEAPIALYPGNLVAQLFIHDVKIGELTAPAQVGQYIGSTGLVPRAMSPRRTYEKLQSLRTSKSTS